MIGKKKRPAGATLEDLVRLTGKAFRTVRSRLEGVAPASRTKRGIFYDPRSALVAIFAADYPPPATDSSEAELRRRKLALEVESLELDVGAKRQRLIDMDHAASVVAGEFAACRARLLVIPTKLAPIIAPMADVDEVRGALASGIEEALAELSAEEDLADRLA